MYIEQSRLNTAYLLGADTFLKEVIAELYADLNGITFKDSEKNNKQLALLYAANTIRIALGDDGNDLGRNDIINLLTTLSLPYEPRYTFNKPVINRHTCIVEASRDEKSKQTLVNNSFSQTTAADATVFQFFQQIGLDGNSFTQSGYQAAANNPFIDTPTGPVGGNAITPVIKRVTATATSGFTATFATAEGLSINKIITISRSGSGINSILLYPSIISDLDAEWNPATAQARFTSPVIPGEQIVLIYLSY